MKQTIATGTAIRDTTRRMLATAGFWLAVSVPDRRFLAVPMGQRRD